MLKRIVIGGGVFLLGMASLRLLKYDQFHTLAFLVIFLIVVAGVMSLAMKSRPRVRTVLQGAAVNLSVFLLGISSAIVWSSERGLLGLGAGFGLLYVAASMLDLVPSPLRKLFQGQRSLQ